MKVPAGRHVTIDCPQCQVRVRATVVADHTVDVFDFDQFLPDHRVSIASCPECKNAILTHEECIGYQPYGDQAEWGRLHRLWPEPTRAVDGAVPAIVQVSLDEADRCHRAGAHTACAVMCGRALEGVCAHFGIKAMLAKALPELHAKGHIDQRLLQWGQELRLIRNAAAHASEEKVSKEDSTDLLHFLLAICDYIFVLTARFESFQKRRASTAKAAPPSGESPAGERKVAE